MGERRPGHVVWWPARTRTCVNHFPCSLGVRREHPAWCRSQDPVSWLGDSVGMLSRTETTSRPIASQPATRPGLGAESPVHTTAPWLFTTGRLRWAKSPAWLPGRDGDANFGS
jgi:hypothetical protein